MILLWVGREAPAVLGRLVAWLSTPRGDGDGEGTVWDVMPDWSYGSGGRLQGGDIARDDQERAVEAVAEQGERLSEARDR